MPFSGIQQSNIKRYGRWILALFLVSWLNLIIQAPAHAAMKQQVALSSPTDVSHCHCPDTLCDTVLNLENQSSEVVHLILDEMPGFQLAFNILVVDQLQQSLTRLDIKHLKFVFEASRPPPLDITRILLI